MNRENLEKLHKNNGNITENSRMSNDSIINGTRIEMRNVCESLLETSQDYQPESTTYLIVKYIGKEEKLDRMLYSEISYYIFSLDASNRGVIVANMAKLLDYSLTNDFLKGEDSSIQRDCRKIIVKLYDHFELAIHQIENAKDIFEKSIEETKVDFSREIKKVERDYITILGIFTSIVLVFIGEFSFSTSVLGSMMDVNIYRLLFIVDILAMIVINIIALLVNMLLKINGLKAEKLGVRWLNIFFVIFAVLLVVGWVIDIASVSSFFRPRMPWK